MTNSLSPICLSDAQQQSWGRDGYVMLGRVLTDEALEQIRADEARLRAELDSNGQYTIFLSQIAHRSAAIRHWATCGPHIKAVQQLIGPDVALWYNQMVTKLPDAHAGKSEFPWHQDNGYVSIEPPTNMTVWVALDDVDETNGCVWVHPQSHEKGLLPHATKSSDSWHLTVNVEGDGVPVVMKAGEAVAFTGLTLHRSKLNHTDQPRRALFAEYCLAGARNAREDKLVVETPHSWVVAGQVN